MKLCTHCQFYIMLLELCYFLTLGLACVSRGHNKEPPPRGKQRLPLTVYYSGNGHNLEVDLILRNVPEKALYYEIWAYGKFQILSPAFRHGSLKHPSKEHIIPLRVKLNNYFSYIFEVALKTWNNKSCNTRGNRKFVHLIYTKEKMVEKKCLDKNCCEITLDWNNECVNEPAAVHGTVPASLTPKVTPTSFIDTGLPFIAFDCTATVHRPQDVLVWYQEKDPHSKPITLNITLPTYHGTAVTMRATLKKTLVDSDRGSKIYCAKRTLNPRTDGTCTVDEDDKSSASEKIELSFTRSIEFVSPTVTVALAENVEDLKPNSVLEFVPGPTLHFECRSSKLVDDGILTWYEEDPDDSTKERKRAERQSTDPATKRKQLALHLNDTSGKNIYCVQEYSVQYKDASDTYGSYYQLQYGEIARSEVIKLRPTASNASATSDGNFLREHKLALAAASVAGALALLAGGLALGAWRRARRRHHQTPEAEYATPQVTYAVLDLPPPGSGKAPKKREKQMPYVEIVGAFKKKSNKT